MVEQRYDAVREVLDGATVKDVATRYGIDRRTLRRWLVGYANEGLAALADKSSRPDRCPHQITSVGLITPQRHRPEDGRDLVAEMSLDLQFRHLARRV